MADSDDIFTTKAMNSQVASAASASHGLMPNRMPTAVATPLPPLKPKNTGHMWPNSTASAHSAMPCSPRP
ncbi:Uncharacterised protein [Chromobacterium violaceum]|uniref:Uncharacterized protein n=1 Tax=Chromobacterium violaceum TaxID=536 RepID=A0A447TJ30_CHRVL|nr:Uncharacterised protein [Chromobacterium violaceum]